VIAGWLTCREAAKHRSPGQGEASLSELRRRPGYRTAVSTSAERPMNHSSKSSPRPTQSKVTFHGFGLGNVVCADRGFCSADVPLSFETQGGGQTRGARPSLPWAKILIPCGEPMPRRSGSSSHSSVLFVLSGLILFSCGRWPRCFLLFLFSRQSCRSCYPVESLPYVPVRVPSAVGRNYFVSFVDFVTVLSQVCRTNRGARV
jgi:hypothetical protein